MEITKNKKLLFIGIAAVALLLVAAIILIIALSPNADVGGVPSSSDSSGSSSEDVDINTPVVHNKFDITGRIFDADGKPLAKTKFMISLNSTEFTTDKNGFFVLKNLPVGSYGIYGFDADGKRIGGTDIHLSTDGAVTIEYFSFEFGETVNLCFDGEGFFAVTVSDEKDDGSAVIKPAEDPIDTTYTDLSWMNDIAPELGGYGLNISADMEAFLGVTSDPSLNYLNSFFVKGSIEMVEESARLLKEKNRKMWLSVDDIIFGDPNNPSDDPPNDRLLGNWREELDYYATRLYAIAGDLFQGFYFDEPYYRITNQDFYRVTKYMRETYNRRVFAVHSYQPYSIPSSKGMDLKTYKPTRVDGLIATEQAHRYVTDVGIWRYQPLRLGSLGSKLKCIDDMLYLMNPNARYWFVPPIETFYWHTTEEDNMALIYEFFKHGVTSSKFGGIMLYTCQIGSPYHSLATIEPTNKQLTDKDFLKNPDGSFVLDEDGNKIVNVQVNNSLFKLPNKFNRGGGYYYIFKKQPNGSYYWPKLRAYIDAIGNGFIAVGKGQKTMSGVLADLEKIYKPNPKDYYEGKYWWDAEGNLIPGGSLVEAEN